jgi:alpha-L-rhamnosidase
MDTVFAQLLVDDHGPVATAYLHRSADELSRVAEILGAGDTAAKYRQLASDVLDAWRTEFIDADGRLHPQSQANLVRALAFGLVPTDLCAQAAADLVELVRAAGTHLGMGFLSTPFLLPVLADQGHLDVAYELLLQDTEPSWLHMTDRTSTIWEDWDAVRTDGTAAHSLNHYSKGAVITFLHGYVAGLRLVDPGYRTFLVAPRPGGGITRARTYHQSPHGRIDVAWQLDGGTGSLELTVPADTRAELRLPDGTHDSLGPGPHNRRWRSG